MVNWISVDEQLGGCKYVCIWRDNLITESHMVCGDEWKHWLENVLPDYEESGTHLIGEHVHQPRVNQTFYVMRTG